MNFALRIGVLFCSVIAAFAPASVSSAAPEPSQVVERFQQSATNVVASSATQMTNTTNTTVSAIERLDRNEQPAEAVQRAADRGKLRIDRLVTQNTNQINRRAQAATRALQRLKADASFSQQVTDAATAAIASVNANAANAKATIDAAVTTAAGS